MNRPLTGPIHSTVLHVEDDCSLGDAVEIALRERRVFSERRNTLCGALEYLRSAERIPDVILLDLCLPDSRGMATLVAVVHEASGTPIVVFTGTDADEGDLDTIRRGATEYLVKGTVNLGDLSQLLVHVADGRAAPQPVVERTNSQVIEMVERVRDVMEG